MRSTWNQFRPKKLQVTGALGLVIALLVAFVLNWLPGIGETFRAAFMFDPTLGKPWTIFTYPLAFPGAQFFFFLIMCWWLYQVGRMLEPSMGMWTYVASFAVFSLLGGIGVAIGDAVFSGKAIAGIGLPVAAMTVLWGARYQSEVVRLMLLIPIKGVWLAAITAALVFFGYGDGNPLIGAFALLPLVAAWFYGTDKIPFMRFGQVPSVADARVKKKDTAEFHTYIDKVRERETERKERERLRALFEDSLEDDDKSDD
ncbi:MAG: hypothetical protein IH944_10665 [Armatimonadetes bacterium]|nr:hypothetical protein [Armatimonadota bacterium]